MNNKEEVSKVLGEGYKDAERLDVVMAHRTILLEAIAFFLRAKNGVHETIAIQRLKRLSESVKEDMQKEKNQ